MKVKMVSLPLFATLALCAGLITAVPTTFASPLVGAKAPLIEGVDQYGKPFKLQEQIGKKAVLLYFYPKDHTSGCIREACGFRDKMEEYSRKNVAVIGVSFDDAASHQDFAAKYRLNFPLLADTDGKIADAYGARVKAGKPLDRRVTFLIGLDGTIKHVTDARDATVHLVEAEVAVNSLTK
jgi:peroxiredoxin Q/BCP